MPVYRYEIPAALCMSVEAADRASADTLAEVIQGRILEQGRGYSVEVAEGHDAILWLDEAAKPKFLTELEEDDDEPAEPTEPHDEAFEPGENVSMSGTDDEAAPE